MRQRRKSIPRPVALLECRCGCQELIQTRIGVLFKNGKASGGTTQWICAACLMRGERVIVV
jgi:hypothetical protein